jgi:pimeloyl-ACP methyl ester carboxylesterase
VKVCMFHLMPYRDLAPDFDQRYKSAYIELIDRAGHLPDLEPPDEVARLGRDFLDG